MIQSGGRRYEFLDNLGRKPLESEVSLVSTSIINLEININYFNLMEKFFLLKTIFGLQSLCGSALNNGCLSTGRPPAPGYDIH